MPFSARFFKDANTTPPVGTYSSTGDVSSWNRISFYLFIFLPFLSLLLCFASQLQEAGEVAKGEIALELPWIFMSLHTHALIPKGILQQRIWVDPVVEKLSNKWLLKVGSADHLTQGMFKMHTCRSPGQIC